MYRPIALAIAAAALLTSACAGPTFSATSSEQPPPTLRLGSDIGDVEAVIGDVIGGAEAGALDIAGIDTLVMVGDSITVASTPALEETFARLAVDNVVIQAQSNKRTASGGQSNPSGADVAASLVDLIESVEPVEPDSDASDHSNELWIVALGTNDIDQYSDPELRAAAIDEMLSNVPAESPLVWVDTYWRDRPAATAELNDTIAERVLERGNSAIAEWNAVAADEGNLLDDGVHPRDGGSIVFANVVGRTILDFVQPN